MSGAPAFSFFLIVTHEVTLHNTNTSNTGIDAHVNIMEWFMKKTCYETMQKQVRNIR